MHKFTHLDLFSGIGGFSLGLESTNLYETVAFCEIEPFARKVLAKHWPDIPCYEDIKSFPIHSYENRDIDILTGGFPCQPVSFAGARKGKEDKRWLWPELSRIINKIRPRWCLIENVTGLRTKHADEVLADLEEQGYTCWPLVVGAVHAGAPHRRQRVWIVAHANSQRESRLPQYAEMGGSLGEYAADSDGPRLARLWQPIGVKAQESEHRNSRSLGGWIWSRAPEPVLRRVDDGLPCGMDRRERIKALGNSVVPQIVAIIGRAIRWQEILS